MLKSIWLDGKRNWCVDHLGPIQQPNDHYILSFHSANFLGYWNISARQLAVSVALLPRYPNPNSWLVLISFRIFHNVNTNVDDQFDSIKKKKATAELLLVLLVLTLQVWITYGSGSSTVGFNR